MTNSCSVLTFPGEEIHSANFILFVFPDSKKVIERTTKTYLAMNEEFTQTGGARYGKSFYWALNFTIPFAHLRLTEDTLVLHVSFLGLWRRTFSFSKPEIRTMRWRRGLFSTGLQIEHVRSTYPPFILFWPSDRATLGRCLKDFGYAISPSW